MPTKKVDTADLRVGMYVAELDHPWLESDFLYQGFFIENEEELRQLRKHCEHVFIDVDKGDDLNDGEQTIAGGDDEAGSPFESEEVKKAQLAQERGRSLVRRLLEDVRLGESVRTEEAREVVAELAETVAGNVNVSMWLASLERQHEHSAVHSLNVCVLALAFARHLGYEKTELEHIGTGALLHDVGLMRVPREILDKPGPLTTEEFERVKRHPLEGHGVMRLVREMPETALKIILCHHERINGAGYPKGLSGADIPREALIVAVADVYDVLTAEMPYADPVTPHEALGIMRQLASSDFGNELVEEFIRCVGIYPVGSLVELTNGELAVVVSHNPQTRLRPMVAMIRHADGSSYPDRPLVNLDTMSRTVENKQAWLIRRVVDPREHGVDMSEIAAEQLGVGK